MSRQSNGQYIQPANTAAVSGQTISSTAYNTLITDIGTEITNSVDRLGRSAMQANLPMGSNKITGVADPTASTDVATKNYVDTTTAAFFSTGDVKITLKTTADSGWILFDDGTFGSATSGSSSRANADTQALFTLFFNNMSDTAAPILTSGGVATTRAGQVSAANAWAANCRMSLPKTLGRLMGIAGAGSGLTSRALGISLGSETVSLATTNLPPYTPTGSVTTTIVSNGLPIQFTGGNNVGMGGSATGAAQVSMSATSTFTGNPQGGASTAFSIMPPSVFMNAMVKL